MANLNVKGMELIALVLMLIPFVSIIGLVIYIVFCGALKGSILKLIIAILTIPFGLLAAIFLWLDAFSVINLD